MSNHDSAGRLGQNTIHFGIQPTQHEPRKLIEETLLAEKCGFDSLWFPDNMVSLQSHSGRLDAWVILTFLASNTKKIRLASAVSDVYRRHPANLAHMGLTLDYVSNGRAIIGVGAGHGVNLTNFGITMEKPLTRLREAIEVIRALLKSAMNKPVDFEGRCFNLYGAFLEVERVRENGPPIYVGAQSRKTRILAGELSDGWFPWLHTREGYREMVKDVDEGARKAGRDPSEVGKVARLFTLISNDEETALEMVGTNLRKSLVLENHILAGAESLVPGSPNLSHLTFTASENNYERLGEAASSVPTSLVGKVATVGSADKVIGVVEDYAKLGSTEIVVRPYSENDLREFGGKVIPYFANRT